MTTKKQPKSILKKTSPINNSERDRNHELALLHANIIQQRKNIELEILFAIETLIDYPLASPPADASNPSATDISKFRDLIQDFQPSDYDSLIEERNINERCGYALCPNKRHKEGGQGVYRLLGTTGKARDFRIVEKAELEKWCSYNCAMRAMYIRVQLNELPAWDRNLVHSLTHVDLLIGSIDEYFDTQNLSKSSVPHGHKPHDIHCLTLERGANGQKPNTDLGIVTVRENHFVNTVPVQPPSLRNITGDDNLHLNLEGHTTKTWT